MIIPAFLRSEIFAELLQARAGVGAGGDDKNQAYGEKGKAQEVAAAIQRKARALEQTVDLSRGVTLNLTSIAAFSSADAPWWRSG